MLSTTLSRQRITQWVEKPPVQYYIVGLILINAVVLGLETSSAIMAQWGAVLIFADRTILALFVVEIALRIYGHGWNFFRDPWGVFDFTIVTIALIPASGPLAVLRALRVLKLRRSRHYGTAQSHSG